MHGTSRARPAAQPAATGMNAVVWIGRDRALVVRNHLDGGPTTTEVAIRRTLAGDLYLVMPAYNLQEQSASARIDRIACA